MSIESVVFGVDIGRKHVRVSAGTVGCRDLAAPSSRHFSRSGSGSEQDDFYGNVTLLGAGSCPSWGMDESGMLSDPLELAEAVRSALLEAEDESGVRAQRVHAALPATILRTVSVTGSVRIAENQPGASGAQRAQQAALGSVELGFKTLHERLIRVAVEPTRGPGGELLFSATYSLLGAHERELHPYRRAIELCGLDVEAMTFAPLAAAEATLSPEERERGAVVVHLEGDAADVVVMKHGIVQYAHATTLPWLAAELMRVGGVDRLPYALVLTGEGVDAARPPFEDDAVVKTRIGNPASMAIPAELAPSVGLLVRANAADSRQPVRALRAV